MLVLTRKQQEKIRIGDDITITVLRTKGKTVRLGIEAPTSVPVLRDELAIAIERETRQTKAPPAEELSTEETIHEDSSREAKIDERHCSEASPVIHQRVSRSRVATVLPTMLGERGPLRAMLNQRASAVSNS